MNATLWWCWCPSCYVGVRQRCAALGDGLAWRQGGHNRSCMGIYLYILICIIILRDASVNCLRTYYTRLSPLK